MRKTRTHTQADHFGDLPPLEARRNPVESDRRGVSVRWLGGSVLTGLASVFLMGGALYAALDGRENLAIPAQAYQRDDVEPGEEFERAEKGNRPVMTASLGEAAQPDSIFMVPTVTREGDQDVVKLRPFMHVSIPLAAVPRREVDFPAFDPLAIFSESGTAEPVVASSEQIYGADVEGEISLKVESFPLGDPRITVIQRQSTRDIEAAVRNAAPSLDVGATALTSVSYFDSARFSAEDDGLLTTPGLSITAENVSTAYMSVADNWPGKRYVDDEVTVRTDLPIAFVLKNEGLEESEAIGFANAIASDLASENLLPDDRLMMTFAVDQALQTVEGTQAEPARTLRRISVFRNDGHMVTVVRKDNGALAYAPPPDISPSAPAGMAPRPLLAANQMPNIYNAIYRSALNEGIDVETVNDLVRIIAFDVDFRSAITASDSLELFLSLEDEAQKPTPESEILYAGLRLGGVERAYYRFPDPETGIVDYYDESGKSAKQFLLREPVPAGRFRSPFGMRRHPITRVRKMHWGVDWSAPRGSPILAAGNGVIEKAGWAGGYGRQTIIRHANGYKTSYSHQNAFAKGIREGARVRQGQVIGYVGSSGLSTGPHLHYEMLVNGNKVNPLKIKLPRGKVFRGEELAAFEAEKTRIDALLEERRIPNMRFASN